MTDPILAKLEKENARLKSLNHDAGAIIARLREAQKWIPVTERLPGKSGYYLIACRDQYRGKQDGINISYYQHKAQNWKATYNPDVTHWMPLPEPPKEE